MGNKSSRPAAPAPAAAPPPPLSEEQKCRIRKQELTQLTYDSAQKQKEVDTCDPKQYYDNRLKKILSDNEIWITTKRREFQNQIATLEEVAGLVNEFTKGGESNQVLLDYFNELKGKKEKYDKETQELERNIRANRRRFLDNSPQEGVPAILMQRTSDDKTLLFFWTVLFGFLTMAIFIGLSYYEKPHSWKTYAAIIAPIWGIAYYVISRYA